ACRSSSVAHEMSKERRAVRRNVAFLRCPLRHSPQGSTDGPGRTTSRPLLRPLIREGPRGPSAPCDEATATTSGAILRPRRTDPWCSGPTCQPVTLELAGSNPVGSAIHPASTYAPSARPDGAFSLSRSCGQWLWRQDDAGRVAGLRSGLTSLEPVRLRCSPAPSQPRPAATNAIARFARERLGGAKRLPLAQFAPVKRLPLVTVLALLAVTVAISVGLAAGSPGASPSPSSGRVAQLPTGSPAAASETSAPPSPPPPPPPPPPP